MVSSSLPLLPFAYGEGNSFSYQSVCHAKISRGNEFPWPGVEVCQHWLENICMHRPCVMGNVQGIWASASEGQQTSGALQISPLIVTACFFLPQVVHPMPAARQRRRMQTRHVK